MTQPTDYFNHHLQLISDLYRNCQNLLVQSNDNTDRDQTTNSKSLLESLRILSESQHFDDDFQRRGQQTVNQVVASFPTLMPYVSRDLLWFFGGDCLHFLSDEEIQAYQMIEDILYEAQNNGEPIDFNTAKSSAFKLH